MTVFNKEERIVLDQGSVVFNNDNKIVILINVDHLSEKEDNVLENSMEDFYFSFSPEHELIKIKDHIVSNHETVKDLNQNQIILKLDI